MSAKIRQRRICHSATVGTAPVVGILLDEAIQVRVRLAQTSADYETAWRIRHAARRHAPATAPLAPGERLSYSWHDAWPQHCTFLLDLGKDCVCTATVYANIPGGLPGDAVFASDLNPLRSGGGRLAEMVFDCVPEFRVFTLMTLVPHLVRVARVSAFGMLRATTLVTVQPSAVAGVLKRYGGFAPIGTRSARCAVGSEALVLLQYDPVAGAATDSRETAFFTRRQAGACPGDGELVTALAAQRRFLSPAAIHNYFVRRQPVLKQAPREFLPELAVCLAAATGRSPETIRKQILGTPRGGDLLAWWPRWLTLPR